MRPIQIVILLVALGAAGVAGLLAMRLAEQPEPQQVAAAPSQPTEEVLVAARDLGLGVALGPDAVTWRSWPVDGSTEGYIVRSQRPDAVSEMKGMLVRGPFLGGEPIMERKLVRSDRGFLSAVLPKGMRAVAVRVNAASTAGGFILPEDRVDVILIRQGGSGGDATSETILHNIRILAIDQTVEQTGEEKKATMVAQDTATLELTPEQAELVTQAQQIGTIALVLRSIEDQSAKAEELRKPTGVSIVKFGVMSRITARQQQ